MQPSSRLSSVDTLLGMATDLWPIIHRLSHLLDARKELHAAEVSVNTSKATVLRTELESTSKAIEIALKEWAPKVPEVSSDQSSPAQDPVEDARIQSILNNAEAYRQAAFVYLYRYIMCCPRTSIKVQSHTKLTLQSCIRVVEWAGPMSALLWPLFVASCEAVSEDDRATARQAFGGIEGRQGMVNISRAWEVVEEVWRRVDLAMLGEEDLVDWREVAGERGVSIVFG